MEDKEREQMSDYLASETRALRSYLKTRDLSTQEMVLVASMAAGICISESTDDKTHRHRLSKIALNAVRNGVDCMDEAVAELQQFKA